MENKITIKDLKVGDTFVDKKYNNDHYIKIVDTMRILEEMKLVYVLFKYMDEDGRECCTYDIYDSTFNVIKLSI